MSVATNGVGQLSHHQRFIAKAGSRLSFSNDDGGFNSDPPVGVTQSLPERSTEFFSREQAHVTSGDGQCGQSIANQSGIVLAETQSQHLSSNASAKSRGIELRGTILVAVHRVGDAGRLGTVLTAEIRGGIQSHPVIIVRIQGDRAGRGLHRTNAVIDLGGHRGALEAGEVVVGPDHVFHVCGIGQQRRKPLEMTDGQIGPSC